MTKYTKQYNKSTPCPSASHTVEDVINFLKKKKETDEKYESLAAEVGISRRTFFYCLKVIKEMGLVEAKEVDDWAGKSLVWTGRSANV